jgi:hypothetical protein
MENCESVTTALNNIAAPNLGALNKDHWEKVVMDYFLHMVSVNRSDLTQRANQAVASYKQNGKDTGRLT